VKQSPVVTRNAAPPPLPHTALFGMQTPDVYASSDARCRAFIVDVLVALGLFFGGAALWSLSGLPHPFSVDDGEGSLFIALFWLYNAGMECSPLQGTVGKLACGIKLTGLDGQRIGFWHASMRFFAQALSIMPAGAGYLIAGSTKRRQALHDLVARTLVTRRTFTPEEIAGVRFATGTDDGKEKSRLMAQLLGLAIIGILGAIAIPAYQGSNLRMQVEVGLLDAAAPYKSAVAEAMSSGREPASIDDPSLAISTTDLGKYVQSIAVTKGVVVITYGRQAHQKLQRRHLLLYPVREASGVISWVCGNAATVANLVSDARVATDIPREYLPPYCR